MRVVRGLIFASVVLSLGLAVASCDSLDLDFFDTKKKLPGERKPVFPEGVPGVTQGIPPDLMKGYQESQQPPAADPATEAAQKVAAESEKKAVDAKAKPKPKPKPKPKKVAEPQPGAQPQPAAQAAWPQQPATQQQQPAQAPWPGSQPQAGWPTPQR